ncbi:MAG: SPOR domain-containing protein [Marinilabiliaceae bacterium]|nr:SPOR domain-containing protein [Marinilabiliaceae bacterium]
MKKILFLLLILSFCNNFFSQEKRNVFATIRKSEASQGKVEITQHNEIEQLMLTYITYNSKKQGIEGYRIQVYSETGGTKARQGAENARTKLTNDFPYEKISLDYDEPYWKVRIGYFRNKHEAIPFLHKIKPHFPQSHIVKTANIKPEYF